MMNRKDARAGAVRPPTERDMRMIKAVDRHGPMTRMQLQKLFFRKKDGLASFQAVCHRLKLLVERGYFVATRLPAKVGSGPYVYQLGRAAIALLNEDGRARRMPRRRIDSAASLLHGLETVDFCIALKEALEARGGEVIAWAGDHEIQCSLTWQGKRLSFTPDAYCRWASRASEGTFFLEWDRGSESMTRISQKLQTYEAYYTMRTYRDHLAVAIKPQILFVVPDERREKKIARWLRRQLSRGRLTALPTVLTAARDAAMRDVLGPVWSTTKADRRVPLVEDADWPDETGQEATGWESQEPDGS